MNANSNYQNTDLFESTVEQLQLYEEMAFEAIADGGDGSHFLGTQHTLNPSKKAFYASLLSDWSNYGQLTDNGNISASQCANKIWKEVGCDSAGKKNPERLSGSAKNNILKMSISLSFIE